MRTLVAALCFSGLLVAGGALAGAFQPNPGSGGSGTFSSEATFNAPVTYGCEALVYAATVNIDFSTKPCKTLAITGDITLTTSNVAAGRNVNLIITGDGSARVFAPPSAWKFAHGNQPALVGPNERITIGLFPTSTTDASISADLGTTPAPGLHGWLESPTGFILNAGSGNTASSSGLTCGFGNAHDGSAPIDGCEVHSSKGKLTLATTLNGGTTGDLDIRVGGSSNNVNLLDSASNVRGCLSLSSSGVLIYGKGCSAGATAPGIFLVDGGASTSRYFDFTGPGHAATEKFVEFRNDLYSGAQEFWKLYGHGVWTMPTTANGGIQTATCAAGTVTVDLSSPIINIVDGAAACVVTISGTSFGSGGVNEDADFLLVVSDSPTGANKVTFAGATSLIPTSCSTTGLNKQGGTARVHYSKVIGKFLFESCQDIV